MRFLSSYNEVLKYTKDLWKDHKRIDIFCSDYQTFVDSVFFKELRRFHGEWQRKNKREKKEITLHGYIPFSLKNPTAGLTNTKNLPYKLELKETPNAKILLDFIQTLKKKSGSKSDNPTLTDIIEAFAKKGDDSMKALNEMLNKLCGEIIQVLPQDDLSKQREESIKQAFEEIKSNIQQIYEEKGSYGIKQIVTAFISVFTFNISKANIYLLAVDVLYTGSDLISNLIEWSKNKYTYGLISPIAKLMASKLAPILSLLNNTSFVNAIVFYKNTLDKKFVIDLSNFNFYLDDSHYKISQGFAIKGSVDTSPYELLELMRGKGDSPLPVYDRTHLTSSDSVLYSQQHIKGQLIKHSKNNSQRLTYIESPFFNSLDLVKCIQPDISEKEQCQKNPLHNYLIISNAPTITNSALTADLVKGLGNEIKYGENTPSINQSSSLISKPSERTDGAIDYSRYEIEIDPEAYSYVLTLSPFVKIPKSKYKKMKEYADGLKSNHIHLRYWTLEASKHSEAYNYISSFIKQPRELDAIFEQEEKYFKEGIGLLRNYIEGLTRIEEIDHTLSSGSPYSKFVPKKQFKAIDVYRLALCFYMIKKIYNDTKGNTAQWYEVKFLKSYEQIEIDGEAIDVLSKKAVVELEYGGQKETKRLCFSEQYKKDQDLSDAICIEEIVNFIDGKESNVEDGEMEATLTNILGIESSEFRKSNPEEGENGKDGEMEATLKKESSDVGEKSNTSNTDNINIKDLEQFPETLKSFNVEAVYSSFSQGLITSIFPFAEFFYASENPKQLFAKLTKTLINFSTNPLSEALKEELGAALLLKLKKEPKVSQKIKVLQEITDDIFKYCFSAFSLEGIEYSTWFEQRKSFSFSLSIPSPKELKNFCKSIGGDVLEAVIKSILLQLLSVNFQTHYEKQKEEYEKILFLRYTNRYSAPYALKRDEAVYIPMLIFNAFTSFNFHTLITGTKLCTGGLGRFNALHYQTGDSEKKEAQNFLLRRLFQYLCLDELRSGKVSDSITIEDDVFFLDMKTRNDEIDFRGYKLALDGQGEESDKNIREAVRNSYVKSSGGNSDAIEDYDSTMQYLQDISKGIFNTSSSDNESSEDKHREFIKALDTIGKNNIRGLYVGIDPNDTADEPRPKIIGRLATTIIPRGGLWIG